AQVFGGQVRKQHEPTGLYVDDVHRRQRRVLQRAQTQDRVVEPLVPETVAVDELQQSSGTVGRLHAPLVHQRAVAHAIEKAVTGQHFGGKRRTLTTAPGIAVEAAVADGVGGRSSDARDRRGSGRYDGRLFVEQREHELHAAPEALIGILAQGAADN